MIIDNVEDNILIAPTAEMSQAGHEQASTLRKYARREPPMFKGI